MPTIKDLQEQIVSLQNHIADLARQKAAVENALATLRVTLRDTDKRFMDAEDKWREQRAQFLLQIQDKDREIARQKQIGDPETVKRVRKERDVLHKELQDARITAASLREQIRKGNREFIDAARQVTMAEIAELVMDYGIPKSGTDLELLCNTIMDLPCMEGVIEFKRTDAGDQVARGIWKYRGNIDKVMLPKIPPLPFDASPAAKKLAAVLPPEWWMNLDRLYDEDDK